MIKLSHHCDLKAGLLLSRLVSIRYWIECSPPSLKDTPVKNLARDLDLLRILLFIHFVQDFLELLWVLCELETWCVLNEVVTCIIEIGIHQARILGLLDAFASAAVIDCWESEFNWGGSCDRVRQLAVGSSSSERLDELGSIRETRTREWARANVNQRELLPLGGLDFGSLKGTLALHNSVLLFHSNLFLIRVNDVFKLIGVVAYVW